MKKLFTISMFIFFILINKSVLANSDSSKAMRCSSLLMILTALSNVNEGLGNTLTYQKMSADDLANIYQIKKTGKGYTNGEIQEINSNHMKKIGKDYPNNYNKIEKEIHNCMGWVASVQQFVASKQNSINDNNFMDILLSGPRPGNYKLEGFENFKPYIKVAFDEWIKLGMITPR